MGMAFFFCLRESGSRRLFLTSPTGFAKMWDSNTGNDRSVTENGVNGNLGAALGRRNYY